MTKSEKELFKALMEWWEEKRPNMWTEDNHLQIPTVNCKNAIDGALASALVDYLTSAPSGKKLLKSSPVNRIFKENGGKYKIDDDDTLQLTVVKTRKNGVCHIEVYDKETGYRKVKKVNVDIAEVKN